MVSRRTVVIVMILVAGLSTIAGIYTVRWLNQPDYGDVSVDKAAELIESNPDLVIIDVRSVEEYLEGHIEGAISIPLDSLPCYVEELGSEKDILVYCRNGVRSTQAIMLLKEAGFKRLYHMVDGVDGWVEQGYSLVQ